LDFLNWGPEIGEGRLIWRKAGTFGGSLGRKGGGNFCLIFGRVWEGTFLPTIIFPKRKVGRILPFKKEVGGPLKAFIGNLF